MVGLVPPDRIPRGSQKPHGLGAALPAQLAQAPERKLVNSQ